MTQYEYNKKAGDVPNFFLNGKDKMTPTQFVSRIDNAKGICGWDNARATAEFTRCLVGKGEKWLKGAIRRYPDVEADNWPEWKKIFLQENERHALITSVNDEYKRLKQTSTETVVLFNNRVQELNRFFWINLPANVTAPDHATRRPNGWTPAAQADKDAMKAGLAKVIKVAHLQMDQEYTKQFFVTGLRDEIRTPLSLKSQHKSYNECIQKAIEIETQNEAKRKERTKARANAIAKDKPVDEVNEVAEQGEWIPDEEYEELCAMHSRAGLGKPSRYRKPGSGPPSAKTGGKKNTKNLTCFWCGKKGHILGECYSKKNGKPKTYNPVASVDPQPALN